MTFHMTPRFVGVQKHKQIRRAIAPVLAIVSCRLPGYGRNRLAHLADQLRRALIETHDGKFRIGCFRIQIEHVLHAGDIGAIHFRDALRANDDETRPDDNDRLCLPPIPPP